MIAKRHKMTSKTIKQSQLVEKQLQSHKINCKEKQQTSETKNTAERHKMTTRRCKLVFFLQGSCSYVGEVVGAFYMRVPIVHPCFDRNFSHHNVF